MSNNFDPMRRKFAMGACATTAVALMGRFQAVAQAPVNDHGGRVYPPRLVPDILVQCADGKSLGLASLLRGKATALHFIFTQCTTTCPMQGAIFEKVQEALPDQTRYGLQLLSLSIDPQSDTPPMLRSWLQRFHARPGWTAAAPRPDDLDTLRNFFGDGNRAVANHISQVQIVDRNGALIWHTFDLPSPEAITTILRKMEV